MYLRGLEDVGDVMAVRFWGLSSLRLRVKGFGMVWAYSSPNSHSERSSHAKKLRDPNLWMSSPSSCIQSESQGLG